MTREEAIKEIEKAFEPAFANYIVTALTEGATVSEQEPTIKNDLGVDCISRADVNRLICKYRDYATETGNERDLERAYGANKVGILISKLPSVTPQEPKWIPVSERLPKEPYTGKIYRDPSESVLVQLSGGGIRVSRYWSHMNSIRTNLNNWIDLYSFEEVVAWMPLPKPYEESEGV